MKNRVSGLLMETGVEYNKQRLHRVSYFRELLPANEEVHPSIRPLLKLSRETIERCQKTEYALVSSLQRDRMLVDRIKRFKTIPGVGQITALTWALEIGDVSRFRTIKQAIQLFWDWQRTQTQSSVRTLRSLRQQMDVWFCRAQEPMPRGTLLR
jgi:transposase